MNPALCFVFSKDKSVLTASFQSFLHLDNNTQPWHVLHFCCHGNRIQTDRGVTYLGRLPFSFCPLKSHFSTVIERSALPHSRRATHGEHQEGVRLSSSLAEMSEIYEQTLTRRSGHTVQIYQRGRGEWREEVRRGGWDLSDGEKGRDDDSKQRLAICFLTTQRLLTVGFFLNDALQKESENRPSAAPLPEPAPRSTRRATCAAVRKVCFQSDSTGSPAQRLDSFYWTVYYNEGWSQTRKGANEGF